MRYMILSSGAIWAWLLSSQYPQNISKLAGLLPASLTALLAGEAIRLKLKIRQIGEFIETTETELVPDVNLCWEQRLRDKIAQ